MMMTHLSELQAVHLPLRMQSQLLSDSAIPLSHRLALLRWCHSNGKGQLMRRLSHLGSLEGAQEDKYNLDIGKRLPQTWIQINPTFPCCTALTLRAA
jgi:hypothetical protein